MIRKGVWQKINQKQILVHKTSEVSPEVFSLKRLCARRGSKGCLSQLRAAISGTTSTRRVVTLAALEENTRETSSQLTGASSSFHES